MRKLLYILFFVSAVGAEAQESICTSEDSLFITRIIEKHARERYASGGEMMLAVAEEFIGQRYVAGTLDKHPDEPLFISASELDCTTFMELVLAISVGIRDGARDFKTICHNLEKIRYRGGRREGYASRLHYISEWIEDSAKQHIVKEVRGPQHRKTMLNLHYMSSNPASYNALHDNPLLTRKIALTEEPFRGKTAYYIPKELLYNTPEELGVKNGDIIALTTNIDGLDVVHIGFAFTRGERLHLLHASSSEGKVVKDNRDLYSYQKARKKQTGIRVFRITE